MFRRMALVEFVLIAGPMVTNTIAPDIDSYWNSIASAVPVYTPEEQRSALTLYRELAKGEPVALEQFATASGVSLPEAKTRLDRPSLRALTYLDDRGRVLGFGGLAVAPMHHRFNVGGRALWTWCAWDSLFIPQLLGADARVESPDPETGEVVRVDVAPAGITSVLPTTTVMSFLAPDASAFQKSATSVMKTFCHFVFFFASRATGELWIAKHPGAFLYSLEEAAVLARRFNSKNFGLPLRSP